MQWWCSADGIAWTWAWRAYPGVWLAVLAIGIAYYRLTRDAPKERRRDVGFGWFGVALIWAALDWPLGPLAAGYLASAHALQFLLLALAAAPLLLLGVRGGGLTRIPTSGVSGGLVRLVTFPLVGVVIFNIVTIATHTTYVVDTLMVSQLGAFLTDLAWFASALLFWWPVIVPIPARPHFTGLFQVLYLFLGTIFHTIIAIIMLLSQHPLYGVYELAPPMTGLSSLQDLHIAGGIMEFGGAAIMFPVMSWIFFKWVKSSEDGDDTYQLRPRSGTTTPAVEPNPSMVTVGTTAVRSERS